MLLQTALDRFRLNPLRDSTAPYRWSNSELVDYFNEILDQLCEETGVLVDSDTPEICQIIVGVVAANMARGTNAATVKVVTAFKFMNDDSIYTFPVTDNIEMTACTVQAVSTYCRYLICTDSDFNVTVQKGEDSATDAGAYLPLMTVGLTPIGMVLIQTNASNTFTSGTTSLNGTGITATFEDSASSFTLDSRVVRINSAELAGSPNNPEIDIKDKFWMNRNVRTWRSYSASIPQGLIHGKNKREYEIWPEALYPDQILMTVSRRPLVPLVEAADTEIELPAQYIKRCYNGVAQLAFLKRDQETWDPERAADHGGKWLEDIDAVKRDLIKLNQTPEVNELPAGVMS